MAKHPQFDPNDPLATSKATDILGSKLKPPPLKKPTAHKKPTLGDIDIGTLPTKKTAVPGKKGSFDAILKKYPQWEQYKATIIAAENQWNVDRVKILTVLIAINRKADPRNLASINDKSVQKSYNPDRFQEFQNLITKKYGFNPKNFSFAINYLAWRLNGQLPKYGDDEQKWWQDQYATTPNAKGGPNTVIKGAGVGRYQGTPTKTPEGQGERNQSFKVYAKSLTDPYVMGIGKDGTVEYNSDPGDTEPVHYDGIALTRSGLAQVRRYLEPYYISYTGGRPSDKTILANMNLSTYTITAKLSKDKKVFQQSPIYRKMALAYKGAARDLLPKGKAVPYEILRRAIVNEWSEGALQEKLREQFGYEGSSEYHNNHAVLDTAYRGIMGVPDQGAAGVIDRATRLGWTQPVFESWLRSTPSYKYSPEYQAKAVNFLDSMGLFIGARPTISPETAKNMAKVGDTHLGTGTITPPLDLMPGLGKTDLLKGLYPSRAKAEKPTPKPVKTTTAVRKPPTPKKNVVKPPKTTTTSGKKPLY